MSQAPALGQSPASLITQGQPPSHLQLWLPHCILAQSCWRMALQSGNWCPLQQSIQLSSSSQLGKACSVWASTSRRSRDETGLWTLTPSPHLPAQPHGPFFSASQQPLSCSYFSLGNLLEAKQISSSHSLFGSPDRQHWLCALSQVQLFPSTEFQSTWAQNMAQTHQI